MSEADGNHYRILLLSVPRFWAATGPELHHECTPCRCALYQVQHSDCTSKAQIPYHIRLVLTAPSNLSSQTLRSDYKYTFSNVLSNL